MMLGLSPLASSIVICSIAAALEGLCAGNGVASFFASLKFPRYALPLWAWMLVGGGYYGLFGFVLYRVAPLTSPLATATYAIVLFMMLANALSNYVIFRMRDLRLAFLIGALAPVFDIALFGCLMNLDRKAGIALLPYLMYRAYAVWWGHALWKLNTPRGTVR